MRREKTDAHEMVSVRLPKSMLSKIDDWAEKMEASRTSFIRGAIASYFRFEHGIFVPLSSEHRRKLAALAHARAIPAETLAEETLERGLGILMQQKSNCFSQTSTLKLNQTRSSRGTFKSHSQVGGELRHAH